MRVARVVLHNVKSYAESTVIDLAPGINAVCGENGAGKSTILEAIGFTLFGYRPYKLDAFLREGEKSGSIVVTVEDDDGCSYQLERKLGSNAGQAVYDETGTRIAEGEADVRAWRLGFFGMEPGSDLAKLFEDTVGPPQGTLTSVFLEGTADKKDKFDRLLGIKDYPRAAEELRALSNHFRGLAEEAGRRAANLEGRVARLPSLEERHGERVGRRSELGAQLDALAQRQEALVATRDRLEGALRAVQAAASALEMAEARARDAQRREGELAAELRRAEEAARAVEESRPGALAYGEAEALLKTLEARRRERDRLQEEVRSAERNAFQWAQQAKSWEEKLESLAADEARAAELASLAPEQERREKAVSVAQERVRARREAEALRPAILQRRSAALERRSEAEAQLARVEAARPEAEKLEGLRDEQRSLQEQVVALEKSAWALDQAETDLAREKDRLVRLSAEAEALRVQVDTLRPLEALASQLPDRQQEWDAAFGESRGLEARLQEAQRSRKQVEGGLCPFLHEPCNNLRPGVSLDAHFDGVIAETSVYLEKFRAALPALSAQLERCRSAQRDSAKLPDLLARLEGTAADKEAAGAEVQRLDSARRELASAPASLLAAREGLAALETALTRAQAAATVVAGEAVWRLQAGDADRAAAEEERTLAEVDDLIAREAGAAEALAAAQAALVEIGDPRGQAGLLSQRVARERPEAQRNLERASQNAAMARAAEEKRRREMEPFAGLAEEMAAATMARDDNQAAHHSFLANQAEANRLPQRRADQEGAIRESAEASSAREQAARGLEAARAGYDEAEHARLRSELEGVSQEVAQGRRELELCREEIDRLALEMAGLLKDRAAMEGALAESEECRALRDAVDAVRDVLRKAGPEIAREMVRRVSGLATSLYRELLGDPGVFVEWGDDYEVRCRIRAEEREFKQLSGGEQMAAALAVRLALLQAISNIRLAFLDEPTAHMDALRRVNLASQIQNLRSFDQLVVISHDDSFDTLFGHVVRLAKRSGATVVED